MVGLVAVDLRGFQGSSANQSSCQLRAVDELWNSWLARDARLLAISILRDEMPCWPMSVVRSRRRR